MARRLLFLAAVALAAFSLSSCIDYVQSVSYRDGRYRLYYKVTLSRLLMDLADSDSDEYVRQWEDGFAESVIASHGFEMKPVDTTMEVGVEVVGEINPKKADEETGRFLPKKSGDRLLIPFLPFAEKDFSENNEFENQFAQALLSSAKFRVMVEKRIAPTIASAYFEGRHGSRCGVPVYDYGGMYCMEIPAVVFFQNEGWNCEHIIVLTE